MVEVSVAAPPPTRYAPNRDGDGATGDDLAADEAATGGSPADATPIDEQALVAGLGAGAPWARQAFCERTHDATYAWASRLTRDADLRRDWTHDALLRVMADVAGGRFTWRRPGSFWAWFRARAPYLLLDSLRERRRLESRERGVGDELPPLAAPDDPSLDLENLEIVGAVVDCLESLANPDQRQALTLLLYEECSYEEIAAAVGRPLNTVRTDIRRGRLALREDLARRLGLDA